MKQSCEDAASRRRAEARDCAPHRPPQSPIVRVLMNSRASRASRASASTSMGDPGSNGSLGNALFVVPQTPPRAWAPPPSANFENFESVRALDASLLQRDEAGGENAAARLLRRFRVAEFALTAGVWFLSRVVLMVVDVHKRTNGSSWRLCHGYNRELTV